MKTRKQLYEALDSLVTDNEFDAECGAALGAIYGLLGAMCTGVDEAYLVQVTPFIMEMHEMLFGARKCDA